MWPLSLFLIQWLMDWSMIKSKLIYKKKWIYHTANQLDDQLPNAWLCTDESLLRVMSNSTPPCTVLSHRPACHQGHHCIEVISGHPPSYHYYAIFLCQSSTHTEARSSITDDIWLCNVNGIFIFASWIFGDFLNIILFANSMFDNV